MIERVADSGFASHEELEPALGRLSSAQTSVFGRIGGGMMSPLCAKLRDFYYRQALSLYHQKSQPP